MLGQKVKNRFAFVVGNENYPGDAKLNNPSNDARAMRAKLMELGFEVHGYDNRNFSEFQLEFEKFLTHLETKDKVDTALIYFAGHGFQRNNDNYIVPISRAGQSTRFINVQDLISLASRYADKCLLFLDACRTYPNENEAREQLDRTQPENSRFLPSRFMVDVENSTRKLSGIETDVDTFMAFSAAPGQIALDGTEGSHLSPFTSALIEHLGAVDLPLNLVMTRVRESVLSSTGGAQRTWDNSSLTQSYFFNGSNVFLLVGNIFGFIAALLAFLFFALRVYQSLTKPIVDKPRDYGFSDPESVFVAALVFLLGLVILGRGINRSYQRIKGVQTVFDEEKKGTYEQLALKGLLGGVTGAILASWMMAVPYYLAQCGPNYSFIYNAVEATFFGILVYGAVGIMTLCTAEYFRINFGNRKSLGDSKAALLGAIFGGTLGALLMGYFPTIYFGNIARDPMKFEVPILGVFACTALIVFTVENFSLDKISRSQFTTGALAAIIGTGISAIPFGILISILWATGVLEVLIRSLEGGSNLELAWIIFALTYGPLMGLSIGLTRMWTQKFNSSI